MQYSVNKYPEKPHYTVWASCDWQACDFWYKGPDGARLARQHVAKYGHPVTIQAVHDYRLLPDRAIVLGPGSYRASQQTDNPMVR